MTCYVCGRPGSPEEPRLCVAHWVSREIFGTEYYLGAARTYTQAHHAVATLRGKAREHTCVTCGGPAAHWSYTHSDPEEGRSKTGSPFGRFPIHYAPRCHLCHKRFDLAVARRREMVAA